MKCYVIPTIIHYMQQKRTSNPLGSFLRMWYTVSIIYSIILLGERTINELEQLSFKYDTNITPFWDS